ncbi:18760_t:CDS:1, partial [Acaulospora morrowiae]
MDSKRREIISKKIIQNSKGKLSKYSLSVKGGQRLIQELFIPEPSLQESKI